MKRRLVYIVLLSIAGILALLFNKGYRSLQAKREREERIKMLPDLTAGLIKTRGAAASDPVDRTIVNFFSPDCEHCQYMARQIAAHAIAFARVDLRMITLASRAETEKFIKQYGLDSLPFLSVAADTVDEYGKWFGTVRIPSFYFYDAGGRLTDRVEGECRIGYLIGRIKTNKDQ